MVSFKAAEPCHSKRNLSRLHVWQIFRLEMIATCFIIQYNAVTMLLHCMQAEYEA